MNVDELPLVGDVVDAGPDDPVFDGLIVAGPLVIGLVAILGRSIVTRGIVGAYLTVFTLYVLYNGLTQGE